MQYSEGDRLAFERQIITDLQALLDQYFEILRFEPPHGLRPETPERLDALKEKIVTTCRRPWPPAGPSRPDGPHRRSRVRQR